MEFDPRLEGHVSYYKYLFSAGLEIYMCGVPMTVICAILHATAGYIYIQYMSTEYKSASVHTCIMYVPTVPYLVIHPPSTLLCANFIGGKVYQIRELFASVQALLFINHGRYSCRRQLSHFHFARGTEGSH